MAVVRTRVVFHGYVQGVGFRYTTRLLANGYAVSGWVMNLPDGSVELEAQGEEAEVARFLAVLRREMRDHVSRDEAAARPVVDGEAGFAIRF